MASRAAPWNGPSANHRRSIALIAAAAAVFVVVPSWLGVVSLPALGLFATLLVAIVWSLTRVPEAWPMLIPGLIFFPMLIYTYAWELGLLYLFGLMLVSGTIRGARWLTRLTPLDVGSLAMLLLAIASFTWSENLRWYLIGLRVIVLGFITLWVSSRLPVLCASIRPFQWGLVVSAFTLSVATLSRRISTGFGTSEAMLHRGEITDLGWGMANYIAALLLVLGPPALAIAIEERRRPLGIVAWLAFAAVATVQFVVASRAGALLFVGGVVAQLMSRGQVRSVWLRLVVIAGVLALVLSPIGIATLSRFVNLRDVGSMVIRIWYMREGWTRLLDHLPFGLGCGQGYGYPDKLQGGDTHNYWLQLGGDLGLPGLLIWAYLMWRVWRALKAAGPSSLAGALRVAFILSQLHTMVEPTFQGTQYRFLFFWVFGGALAYLGSAATRLPAEVLVVPRSIGRPRLGD